MTLQRLVGNRALTLMLRQPKIGVLGDPPSALPQRHIASTRDVPNRESVLQRQGIAGLRSLGYARALLNKMKRFFFLTPAEWKTAAANASVIMHVHASAPDIVDKYLRFCSISWENVTREQRALFMALDNTRREKLRVDALSLSSLYNAITRMHVPGGRAAAATKLEQRRIERMRKGPIGRRTQFVHADSAAYKFATGDIAIPALVAPVRAAIIGKTTRRDRLRALNTFANSGLARWVYYRRPHRVKRLIKGLACGIGNLFAFALSRGDVPIASSASPTIADAAGWLKKWTLDGAVGRRLITAWIQYNPKAVIRALSHSRKAAVTGGRVYTPPSGTKKTASRAFNRFLGGRIKRARLTPTEETRLALVQGRAKVHSFLVYKDLDGVWRSMDIYLNLEDKAPDKYGSPGRYSSQVSTIYFVVDNK